MIIRRLDNGCFDVDLSPEEVRWAIEAYLSTQGVKLQGDNVQLIVHGSKPSYVDREGLVVHVPPGGLVSRLGGGT